MVYAICDSNSWLDNSFQSFVKGFSMWRVSVHLEEFLSGIFNFVNFKLEDFLSILQFICAVLLGRET